jgi:soluble lytic murein transglycosylase-like protein
VNSESILINSAGSVACGIFSIMMIFFLIGFPAEQGIHEKLNPIIKGVRPFKAGIIDEDFSKTYLNYQVTKRESQFSPIINKAADKHKIDAALIKAIILAESGYNPLATSEKGAVGLMQIMPGTAMALSTEDMYNPVHNIDAGVEYLKLLLDEFGGDLALAIAAYNAGSSKVHEYQGIPPYEGTRHFVKEVFEYYRHYQGA